LHQGAKALQIERRRRFLRLDRPRKGPGCRQHGKGILQFHASYPEEKIN
jgi:hypothetical protein